MAVIRLHRFRVARADLDNLLSQRRILIDGIRRAHPGLTETRLTRLEDGTYLDTWRWDSAEHMLSAVAAAQGIPLVDATEALMLDATALTGEILDETP
ncbi:hypothetical protein AB0I30_07630 [Nocardia tengchongensis]|uniref:hypothetical protein n=1 Tax=Nocardia tengchongensis TaxID=2055889 RepID=UPI0033E34977